MVSVSLQPCECVRLLVSGGAVLSHTSSALDTRHNVRVALKKISRPFESHIHAKRTYRELRLLKHMKHENVSVPCIVWENFSLLHSADHRLVGHLHFIWRLRELPRCVSVLYSLTTSPPSLPPYLTPSLLFPSLPFLSLFPPSLPPFSLLPSLQLPGDAPHGLRPQQHNQATSID